MQQAARKAKKAKKGSQLRITLFAFLAFIAAIQLAMASQASTTALATAREFFSALRKTALDPQFGLSYLSPTLSCVMHCCRAVSVGQDDLAEA